MFEFMRRFLLYISLLLVLPLLPGCRTTPVDEADAERREFILFAVRQLAKRDMEVKTVELGYTSDWTLQFVADGNKLLIGEPQAFCKSQREKRGQHFKA